MQNAITWRTNNIYIDIDTGEILTESNAKENYIIIKKIKNAKIRKETGYITITNECRKSKYKQTALW